MVNRVHIALHGTNQPTLDQIGKMQVENVILSGTCFKQSSSEKDMGP